MKAFPFRMVFKIRDMMKRAICGIIALTICLSLAACGKDTLRMSAGEIVDNVVYNESMVGVSGTLNKHFRPQVTFDNNAPDKDKYMTNNVHSGLAPQLNVNITEGAYCEAFVDVNGTEYARAAVAALVFENAQAAEEALATIEQNLNLSSNEDGTCDLEYGKVSIKKNAIFVVAAYENNTQLELTRVFNNNNYIY